MKQFIDPEQFKSEIHRRSQECSEHQVNAFSYVDEFPKVNAISLEELRDILIEMKYEMKEKDCDYKFTDQQAEGWISGVSDCMIIVQNRIKILNKLIEKLEENK